MAKQNEKVVREIMIEGGPLSDGYIYSIERWIFASGKWVYSVHVEYDDWDRCFSAFANDRAKTVAAARLLLPALLACAKNSVELAEAYAEQMAA